MFFLSTQSKIIFRFFYPHPDYPPASVTLSDQAGVRGCTTDFNVTMDGTGMKNQNVPFFNTTRVSTPALSIPSRF